MRTQNFIRKDKKKAKLHIYYKWDKTPQGHYTDRGWLCTIQKKGKDIDLNDGIVLDLADMRFILGVADNFQHFFEAAKEDAWNMYQTHLIPDENFR